MIGKLKTMVSDLRYRIINMVPIKGLMLSIIGAGTSAPAIQTSYNVASVTRTGVGVYSVTYQATTFFGTNIATDIIVTSGHVIAPSAGSEFFVVSVTKGVGQTFDITVEEVVVGGGNKLEVQPYDLLATDSVDVSGLINAGHGILPPA